MGEREVRVLMITGRADNSGGPVCVSLLCRHLPRDRCSCTIAAPRQFPYWERLSREPIVKAMHEIAPMRLHVSKLPGLYGFARAHRSNLIHAHGRAAGMYARLLGPVLGAPVVLTYHGVQLQSYAPAKRRLVVLAERMLNRFADAVISVSPSEREVCLRMGLARDNTCIVIPNGVEIRGVEPGMEAATAKRGRFTLGTIARFGDDDVKGMDVLFETVRCLRERVDDLRCLIVGGGPTFEEMQGVAKRMGIGDSIEFAGEQPDAWHYLGRMDVFVSTSRREGMPLALLEAMGAGCPVVATDVVGNRDVVRDGVDGLLAESENAANIAEKILKLRDEPELGRAFAKNARQRVREHFDARTMAVRTYELYCEVMARRKP